MKDLAFVIPAYQAEPFLGKVLTELRVALSEVDRYGAEIDGAEVESAEVDSAEVDSAEVDSAEVIVVDDGSTDSTASVAEAAGVTVLRHHANLGKGAALLTALRYARDQGIARIVTLDADGQHPPREAIRLALHPHHDALVLGVRDLRGANAPRANRFSNGFSNAFLSFFALTRLRDTQCGLRRYPVEETLRLGARQSGYAFESDLVLRAARRRVPIEQVPVSVVYPPQEERLSHFDAVRDPAKIVVAVCWTALTVFPKGRS